MDNEIVMYILFSYSHLLKMIDLIFLNILNKHVNM